MYVLQLKSQMSFPPFQFFSLVPLLGSNSKQTTTELLVPPFLLWHCSPPRAWAFSLLRFLNHTQRYTHAHAQIHIHTHARTR